MPSRTLRTPHSPIASRKRLPSCLRTRDLLWRLVRGGFVGEGEAKSAHLILQTDDLHNLGGPAWGPRPPMVATAKRSRMLGQGPGGSPDTINFRDGSPCGLAVRGNERPVTGMVIAPERAGVGTAVRAWGRKPCLPVSDRVFKRLKAKEPTRRQGQPSRTASGRRRRTPGNLRRRAMPSRPAPSRLERRGDGHRGVHDPPPGTKESCPGKNRPGCYLPSALAGSAARRTLPMSAAASARSAEMASAQLHQ
jgi:hypothetical protein